MCVAGHDSKAQEVETGNMELIPILCINIKNLILILKWKLDIFIYFCIKSLTLLLKNYI